MTLKDDWFWQSKDGWTNDEVHELMFEIWKEMIDKIKWRINEGTMKIDMCKYDMETLVRPWFGDYDPAYEYLTKLRGD